MSSKEVTINEGQNYQFKLKTELNTTGKELVAYIFDHADLDDDGTEVGSKQGEDSNVVQFITLDFISAELEANKDYELEIWADPDTPDATLVFPDEEDNYILSVQDRRLP